MNKTMQMRALVRRCGAVVLILASAAAVQAGADVQMNADAPGTIQNEVSLTLNPGFSAANVVAVYNDDVHNSGTVGISYSNNYGAAGSWSDRQLSTPTHPMFLGTPTIFDGQAMNLMFDPISGADTQGRVYAGYIGNINGPGGPSGLYVEYSDDGGATWTLPPLVPPDTPPTAGQPIQFNLDSAWVPAGTYRFNDKPHLTVDRWGPSPNTDNVYVTWIQDDGINPQGDILFSSSTTRGASWSAPVFVNDNFNPRLDLANGPNATVAPDGSVFVAWLDVDVTTPGAKPGSLMLDRSTNSGATWGTDMQIFGAPVRTLPNNLSTENGTQDARARGYPSIAVNPANSNHVYMVYAADPDYVGPGNDGADEADVFFTRVSSTDGWSTFNSTAPIRINDDSTVTDQMQPWIAVKPDGTIDVVWYDKRNSPDGDLSGQPDDNEWDVYIAQSTDGGTTFSGNLRVTDQSFLTPFPPTSSDPWIGEYLGLAVDGTHAYIGFTSAISDLQNGDVYFDRIANSQIPEPGTLGLLGLLALGLVRRRRA